MGTGITLIVTGWAIGFITVAVVAGAQWWHRRNLTDAQLFPELSEGE